MTELSAQSQKYLTTFKKLLKFYPKSHRTQYGEAMVQLLKDELYDAERLNDVQVRRDVFLSAVLELPGSLVREYFWAIRAAKVENLLLESRVGGWRLLNYIFFISFGLVCAGSVVAGIVAALTLVTYAILLTRRLFLGLVVIASGILSSVLVEVILAAYSSRSIMATTARLNKDSLWIWLFYRLFEVAVPFLVAYFVVGIFHRHPKRFRRPPLSELSEEEAVLLRALIHRRRRRNIRIFQVAFAIVILANVAGLYDPPVNSSDLMPAKRSIPDAENMIFDLEKLQSISTPPYAVSQYSTDFTTTDAWDENRADTLIQRDQELVHQFAKASTEPLYQNPSTADLYQYTTAQGAASAYIPSLGLVRNAAAATLLRAEKERRSGDVTGSLQDTEAVLHVGDAILSSQSSIIEESLGLKVRSEALTYTSRLLINSSFSTEQYQQLAGTLSQLHQSSEGMVRSLKTEYYLEHIAILELRSLHSSQFIPETPFLQRAIGAIPFNIPYLYQPNRTLAGVNKGFRIQVAALQAPCDALPRLPAAPSYSAFPLRTGLHLMQYNGIGKHFIDNVYIFQNYPQKRCDMDKQLVNVQAEVASKLP